MSVSTALRDRPGDADRPVETGEAFAFAPPDPVWAPLGGERQRAAARLVAFVGGAGVGIGIVLWVVAELATAVARGVF